MSIIATTPMTAATGSPDGSDAASAGAPAAPAVPAADLSEPPRGAPTGAAGDEDGKGSIIRPRPGTEPDLREACAIDLDKPKPENARAARVWVAGRDKRKADRRRDQAIATLDAAWSDYVASVRSERDAEHLASAKLLASKGVDLKKLVQLAAMGRLPDALLRGE